MKQLAAGLALSVFVAGILYLAMGPVALLPAFVFGWLATAIQVAGAALARRASGGSFQAFVRGWVVGTGLRLLGVVLVAVAVLVRRELFPPLPTAFGFLGVLIPLLFMEIRLSR